jgi:predicted nucleic-acid-binding protein
VIVDANVLLRALEGGASAQARAVRRRIEAARGSSEKLAVLSATVLEVVYVLESEPAGFGWGRDDVARAIEAVLDEPAFSVEHQHGLRDAMAVYRSRSIDLHDCLLSAIATERNDRVLSFDKDLRKLGNAEQP